MALGFVTGGISLGSIAKEISKYKIAARDAKTDQARIEAQQIISQLESREAVLIAEQKSASTRWVRPAFAALVWIYWAKLIIYDTVLGWGATGAPSDHVKWFVVLIPTAYFLVRPSEKR